MTQATDERASRIVRGPFEGMYGAWNLTQGEVDGVLQYRGALLASALSAALGIGVGVFGSAGGGVDTKTLLDGLFLLHTAAFGLAIGKIHIYLKPMHDLLKVTYGAGLLGSLALIAGHAADPGLVSSVVAHPALMLAVGWQFVAMTGLFFKEFACFGRLEAVGLFLLTPVITGGHFLGLVHGDVAKFALCAFAMQYVFFAAHKFNQLPEADIGDLSVFEHIAKQRQNAKEQ